MNAPPKKKDPATGTLFANNISTLSDLFSSLLETLFKKVLFEDCQNQWTVSRPMLALILLNPQSFNKMKTELISMQGNPQLQQQLIKDFDELMSEIQMNLDTSNRDKFTTHLNSFVMEVKKYIML